MADGAGEVISDLGLMKGNDWIVLRLNIKQNLKNRRTRNSRYGNHIQHTCTSGQRRPTQTLGGC